MIFVLILLSVTASSIAQLLLKLGMSSPAVQKAIMSGVTFPTIVTIGVNPMVVGGLSIYLFGAVVWLFVLSRVQLSIAYPFVALGFVFTAILARLFVGEGFTLVKTAGTALIVAGVLVLAREAAGTQ